MSYQNVYDAISDGDADRFDDAIETADLTKTSGSGKNVVSTAATVGEATMAKRLLELGAAVNFQNDECKTPLHLALELGHDDVAAVLIDHGADPNIEDEYGTHPLLKAVGNGTYDLTRRLIENSGDPTAENEAGISPLSLARDADAEDFVELLERQSDEASSTEA